VAGCAKANFLDARQPFAGQAHFVSGKSQQGRFCPAPRKLALASLQLSVTASASECGREKERCRSHCGLLLSCGQESAALQPFYAEKEK